MTHVIQLIFERSNRNASKNTAYGSRSLKNPQKWIKDSLQLKGLINSPIFLI